MGCSQMANEKRLIDANALLEKMQFRLPVVDIASKCISDCVAIARKTIVDAPTVYAVEVVHGRWETIAQKTVSRLSRCTACGFEKYNIHWCNYCPNCGAKMDGDGNG